MAKPGNTGMRRIIRAFGFSMQGFAAAWRHEAAFRQETLLAVILLPLSFWLARNLNEWLLLTVTILLVLIVELLNSALEAVVDRISDEHHELAGRAKDIASAAVFVSLCLTFIVWGAVVWDRFIDDFPL